VLSRQEAILNPPTQENRMQLRVIAPIVLFAALMSGCASTQYYKESDVAKVYPVSYEEMLVLAAQAVDVAGMKVNEVKKEQGLITATASPSFWTSSLGNMIAGGDKVEVQIRKSGENGTNVYITAHAPGTLADMGRTGRVVKTLYKHLDDIVAQKISTRAKV